MKNRKGVFTAIVAIGFLVVVGATAVISSLGLNKHNSTNTRASDEAITCPGSGTTRLPIGSVNSGYICCGPHMGTTYNVSYATWNKTCKSSTPSTEPSLPVPQVTGVLKTCPSGLQEEYYSCPGGSYEDQQCKRKITNLTNWCKGGENIPPPEASPSPETSPSPAANCGSGSGWACPTDDISKAKCSGKTGLEFGCCVRDKVGCTGDDNYRVRWYGCTGQPCENTIIKNTGVGGLGHLESCPYNYQEGECVLGNQANVPTEPPEETPPPEKICTNFGTQTNCNQICASAYPGRSCYDSQCCESAGGPQSDNDCEKTTGQTCTTAASCVTADRVTASCGSANGAAGKSQCCKKAATLDCNPTIMKAPIELGCTWRDYYKSNRSPDCTGVNPTGKCYGTFITKCEDYTWAELVGDGVMRCSKKDIPETKVEETVTPKPGETVTPPPASACEKQYANCEAGNSRYQGADKFMYYKLKSCVNSYADRCFSTTSSTECAQYTWSEIADSYCQDIELPARGAIPTKPPSPISTVAPPPIMSLTENERIKQYCRTNNSQGIICRSNEMNWYINKIKYCCAFDPKSDTDFKNYADTHAAPPGYNYPQGGGYGVFDLKNWSCNGEVVSGCNTTILSSCWWGKRFVSCKKNDDAIYQNYCCPNEEDINNQNAVTVQMMNNCSDSVVLTAGGVSDTAEPGRDASIQLDMRMIDKNALNISFKNAKTSNIIVIKKDVSSGYYYTDVNGPGCP